MWPSCVSSPPKPSLHASMHITKSLFGSFIFNIGVVDNNSFNLLKISSHFRSHTIFFPFCTRMLWDSQFSRILQWILVIACNSHERSCIRYIFLNGTFHYCFFILSWYTDIHSSDITWPRYFILFSKNSHSLNLSYSLCSLKTYIIIYKCSSRSSFIFE